MDKLAQKRKLRDKIREFIDVPGKVVEKVDSFMNPEYSNLLEKMRNVDDKVRAEMLGKQIKDASPSNEFSAKYILKEVESKINRREYMTAISMLGMFYEKVDFINIEFSTLDKDVSSIHNKFLFEGLDEDSKNRLNKLHNRIATNNNLTKNSSIADMIYNLTNDRSRSLKLWEKMYPKQSKDLKDGIILMLKHSNIFLNKIASIFDGLSEARAHRNLDKYILITETYKKIYDSYNSEFKAYYNKYVKQWIIKSQEYEHINGKNENLFNVKPNENIPDINNPRYEQSEIVNKPELTNIFDKLQILREQAEKAEKAEKISIQDVVQKRQEAVKKQESAKVINEQANKNPANIELAHKAKETTVEAVKATEIATKAISDVKEKKQEVEIIKNKIENINSIIEQANVDKANVDKVEAVKQKSIIEMSPEARRRAAIAKKVQQPGSKLTEEQKQKQLAQDIRDVEPAIANYSHQNFINSLEKMSNESPMILKAYILKYANMMQELDFNSAIKLMKIAKGI